MMFMQGLAFEDAPVLAAGTRAVLPRLRVRCVDACGNPTSTLPQGVAGLEARAATSAKDPCFCGSSARKQPLDVCMHSRNVLLYFAALQSHGQVQQAVSKGQIHVLATKLAHSGSAGQSEPFA